QVTALVDDFYEHEIVGRIVAGRKLRKLSADQVKRLIDEGPYSAKGAMKAGLLDRLSYFDDYSEALKTEAKAESLKVMKDYGKKKDEDLDMLGLMRKLMFGGGSKSGSSSKTPKVAVIYITGA